eukprot:EG_transcript_4548
MASPPLLGGLLGLGLGLGLLLASQPPLRSAGAFVLPSVPRVHVGRQILRATDALRRRDPLPSLSRPARHTTSHTVLTHWGDQGLAAADGGGQSPLGWAFGVMGVVVVFLASKLGRWSGVIPCQGPLSVAAAYAEESAAEGRTAPSLGDVVAAVKRATAWADTARLGLALRVQWDTSIMGMGGTATLAWEPLGAGVHRAVDCTAALPAGAAPVQYVSAVALALPAGDVEGGAEPEGGLRPEGSTALGDAASALQQLDPGAVCWEQDWSGLAAELELDDAESTALGHWLGTGQWLTLLERGALVGHMVNATACRGLLAQVARLKAERGWPPGPGLPAEHLTAVALRVAGGRTTARLLIDHRSWLPAAAVLDAAGGPELWLWEDWAAAGTAGLPGRAVFLAPGCTPVVYRLRAETLQPLPSPDEAPWRAIPTTLTGTLLDSRLFYTAERYPDQRYPDPSLRPKWTPPSQRSESPDGPPPPASSTSPSPLGAWYDDGAAPDVPVWVGEGGHLLCQPTLGGYTLGLFIVDTGTSCLVIDPDALPRELAERCERFAVHTVQGLGGAPLKSALCRGLGPLVLGPLILERPLFREASLGGAVRGPRGPGAALRIAGVLGYDLLRHCRLEVGTAAPTAGPDPPGKVWMKVRRSGGLASPRVAVGWQRARFLGRVPHLRATLGAAAPPPLSPPREAEGAVEGREEIEALAAALRARTAAAGGSVEAGTLGNGQPTHEGLFRLALGV